MSAQKFHCHCKKLFCIKQANNICTMLSPHFSALNRIFWQQVVYFEVSRRTGLNFSERVRRSEYTLKLAVKKKLNFMSASKPMFLDSLVIFFNPSVFSIFYILRPGKQNAAQLTIMG